MVAKTCLRRALLALGKCINRGQQLVRLMLQQNLTGHVPRLCGQTQVGKRSAGHCAVFACVIHWWPMCSLRQPGVYVCACVHACVCVFSDELIKLALQHVGTYWEDQVLLN